MKKFTISAGDVTNCLRGVVYKKMDKEKPPLHPEIEKLLALFREFADLGQQIQNKVRKFWQDKGVLIAKEDWIPFNDFGFTGKFDAICTIKGKLILYEIKGAGNSFFNWVSENKQPRPEHKIQLMIYYEMLKKNFPGLEPRLLYVSRNAFKYDRKLKGVELPITYTEDEFKVAINNANLVRIALEGGELPPAAPAIVFTFPDNKKDVNMTAITCRHHALCLDNKNWFAETKKKLGENVEDIKEELEEVPF